MSTTVYTWNRLTDSVIEDSDGSGNSLCTYTNEPSQFGPLISESRGGMTSYYHADALGSTRLTTNSSQAVVDSFLFDAWGTTVASIQLTATPYQWCGRWGYQTNAVLTNQSVRERTYQTSGARWSSQDPHSVILRLRVESSFELYIYARNSPTNHSDPSGLEIPASPTTLPLPTGLLPYLTIETFNLFFFNHPQARPAVVQVLPLWQGPIDEDALWTNEWGLATEFLRQQEMADVLAQIIPLNQALLMQARLNGDRAAIDFFDDIIGIQIGEYNLALRLRDEAEAARMRLYIRMYHWIDVTGAGGF